MGKTKDMTFAEKIEYFWDYYKWHTIVIICLLIAVISTLVSCLKRVEPDLRILIVSDVSTTEECKDAFIKKYSKYIDDTNGDGKKNISMTIIQFADYESLMINPEVESAYEEKLKAEIMSGDAHLIIFKDNVKDYLVNLGTFADLSEDGSNQRYYTISDEDKKLLGFTVRD